MYLHGDHVDVNLHGCQFGSFLDGTRPAGCIIESFDFTSKKKVREQSIQSPGEKQQSQNFGFEETAGRNSSQNSYLGPDHPPSNPQCLFSNASFPAFGCAPQIQRYAKTKDAGRSERKEASVHLY